VNCERVHAQITAYLAGELDEPSASSLRGHLRLCEACRGLADQHARMIDALAALPPPEPPPAMWDGVKARLGQAEIEDAGRSRLALWWRRVRPQLVPALSLTAAAAIAAVWIARRHGDAPADADRAPIAHLPAAPPAAGHPAAPPPATAPLATGDVTAALADDDVQADKTYRAAADELLADADDARTGWSPSQTRAFDAKVALLRAAAEHAPLGADRERAWQALIDFVQRAVVGVRAVAEAP
jgi:hypothetical protein